MCRNETRSDPIGLKRRIHGFAVRYVSVCTGGDACQELKDRHKIVSVSRKRTENCLL